eukprot:363047-Chlamydomonas_euryale.AAC.7
MVSKGRAEAGLDCVGSGDIATKRRTFSSTSPTSKHMADPFTPARMVWYAHAALAHMLGGTLGHLQT